jgi:hypothetical protein
MPSGFASANWICNIKTMNCLLEIASADGRDYVTPEDVSKAMANKFTAEVQQALLEILGHRAGCGCEDISLCAFVASEP